MAATGFTDYLSFYAKALDGPWAGMGVVMLFAGINITGIRPMARIQGLMVMVFILALLVFSIGGIRHLQPGHLTPLMPKGTGPILMAAVTGYFSYTGFMVITDMGGEVESPRKTLPLALVMAFSIILVLYFLVTFALTASVPWQSLAHSKSAVAEVGARFLPPWGTGLIVTGAVFAALTCINGVLAATSRQIHAMARGRYFPPDPLPDQHPLQHPPLGHWFHHGPQPFGHCRRTPDHPICLYLCHGVDVCPYFHCPGRPADENQIPRTIPAGPLQTQGDPAVFLAPGRHPHRPALHHRRIHPGTGGYGVVLWNPGHGPPPAYRFRQQHLKKRGISLSALFENNNRILINQLEKTE